MSIISCFIEDFINHINLDENKIRIRINESCGNEYSKMGYWEFYVKDKYKDKLYFYIDNKEKVLSVKWETDIKYANIFLLYFLFIYYYPLNDLGESYKAIIRFREINKDNSLFYSCYLCKLLCKMCPMHQICKKNNIETDDFYKNINYRNDINDSELDDYNICNNIHLNNLNKEEIVKEFDNLYKILMNSHYNHSIRTYLYKNKYCFGILEDTQKREGKISINKLFSMEYNFYDYNKDNNKEIFNAILTNIS